MDHTMRFCILPSAKDQGDQAKRNARVARDLAARYRTSGKTEIAERLDALAESCDKLAETCEGCRT